MVHRLPELNMHLHSPPVYGGPCQIPWSTFHHRFSGDVSQRKRWNLGQQFRITKGRRDEGSAVPLFPQSKGKLPDHHHRKRDSRHRLWNRHNHHPIQRQGWRTRFLWFPCRGKLKVKKAWLTRQLSNMLSRFSLLSFCYFHPTFANLKTGFFPHILEVSSKYAPNWKGMARKLRRSNLRLQIGRASCRERV